ncbi:MAG: flavodoxin [Elusimicrobiota bacterium]|jgi:flavodoxin|nr:flavodoxin [Elusimicrobiota bacterium]
MLKYSLYAVLLITVIVLAGGGFHLTRLYFKNKKEMAPYANGGIKITKNLGKVLVVYYSRSGNTKDIAQRIRQKTNADIYEIKTRDAMPSGPALYLGVKKQLKSGVYPKIIADFPDFSSYDLIFVGSPVWWYTLSTPVLSFLKQADFKGKKVVPFLTQGSNAGHSIADFKTNAKNAIILKEREFNNISQKYNNAVDNKISVWLNELDIN